ncbi:MAG: hypothetical protein COA79_14320 [Planctomycetota bacterium]|nr:MAG: hypothetical protein COA79_14320 [Planctomycetota bacterium]
MKISRVTGIIDRRILVNYHIDPEILAPLLPYPFKPKVINGYAIAGVCLIRLKKVRPKSFPFSIGISSENAAHRFAVEWIDKGQVQEGVYIPRRDTNSLLNSLAGGRIFPGIHYYAKFSVDETDTQFSVSMKSRDKTTSIAVKGTVTNAIHDNSIFDSLQSASDFFEAGSLGYSQTKDLTKFDGLELNCKNWHVFSLNTSSVESSFFDDPIKFPSGSIHFDSALLMRGIIHDWNSRESLCCQTDLD